MSKVSQHIFRFERIRLGKKTKSSTGDKFGPYLYRDIIDNTLISSWEKPMKKRIDYLWYCG